MTEKNDFKMTEKEILNKLGLKDCNNLKNIINNQNNIIEVITFKKIRQYYDLVEKRNSINVEINQAKAITLNNGKYVGWRTPLPNLDTSNLKYQNSSLSIKDLDAGHLLATSFSNFLGFKEKDNFFKKENKNNIFPQTSLANSGLRKIRGQLFFEQKITNYLNKNKNGQIYYEIESIFKNIDDKVPIGNRIFAYSDDEQFNNFHVFIPNCQINLKIDYTKGENEILDSLPHYYNNFIFVDNIKI